MAYTQEQIAGARQWAAGKTGAEIAAKAQELGMSAADVGNILGYSEEAVKATGYGTGQLTQEAANANYHGYGKAPEAMFNPDASYWGGPEATNAWYDSARQWASGKDMQTILDKAGSIGLSPEAAGKVLGASAQDLYNYTGYGGSINGLNDDGSFKYGSGFGNITDPSQKGRYSTMYTPTSGGQTKLSDWTWDKDSGYAYNQPGQTTATAPAPQPTTTTSVAQAPVPVAQAPTPVAPIKSAAPTTAPSQNMIVGQRSQNQDPFAYNTQNPYMAQMANVISNQIGQNLSRNILPTVRSNAQSVGGFGGSRQGVVESNVLNDATRELSNAISSMYYGDYNNAMTRQLQKYQSDSNFDLGLGQLALGNKTADNQLALGLGNLGLGYYQANNSLGLGLGQLGLGNKTADQNYNLGLGQLALGNQNSNNQYSLGLGQLALGNKTADNTYNLGQGQLTLGNKTADNTYNLGLGQLTNQLDIAKLNDATNRYQSDNSLEAARLGANASIANAGTAANAAMNSSNNSYNLGMRNADITELGLSNTLFQNMMNGLAGLGTGLYGIGTTQQNAPWNTLSQFTGSMSGFTPFGQTQQVGGGATGMIGGAMAGAQIGKNLSGSSNPYQLVNTGSIQNTPQYLVSGF